MNFNAETLLCFKKEVLRAGKESGAFEKRSPGHKKQCEMTNYIHSFKIQEENSVYFDASCDSSIGSTFTILHSSPLKCNRNSHITIG